MDHAHGDVKKDLFNWGTWILKETGASGFRFDAVKQWVQERAACSSTSLTRTSHSIDVGFISEFVKHIREASGNPDMFCLGEYWKDSFETNRLVNCPPPDWLLLFISVLIFGIYSAYLVSLLSYLGH